MEQILSKFKGDKIIWMVVLLLSLFSAMAVYSSVETLAYTQKTSVASHILKHMFLIIFSVSIMWVVHLFPYQYFAGMYKLAIPMAILGLLFATFLGERVNEAGRWIKIPIINFTIQPSDFAKVALIMFLARYLSKYQDELNSLKGYYGFMLLVTFVISGLIFIENFSTSVMVLVMAFTMMFVGRVKSTLLFGTIGIGVLFGALFIFSVMNVPDDYLKFGRLKTIKSRIEEYTTNKDKKDMQYQVKQAHIAIARGGILPNGPGNSRQKNFLPNAFSDYVYAIIIEEWGLLGGIVLILLYLTLLYRVVLIVIKSPRTFGALLALGLGLSIVIQAFVNMSVNVGLLPSTGVTLPLVSMGGSSLLFFGVAFGVIISVSRSVELEELGKAPSKETYIDELTSQMAV
jgi:cell division protein FtsW